MTGGSSPWVKFNAQGWVLLNARRQVGKLAPREDAQGGIEGLEGPLADQAALHGVLTKLRDLGLPIISVQALDTIN